MSPKTESESGIAAIYRKKIVLCWKYNIVTKESMTLVDNTSRTKCSSNCYVCMVNCTHFRHPTDEQLQHR